ncbi:MAG: type II toxin-antitoxin system PemK/MazF family toxin [Bacteroidota bacterium]|nr:type II toxin-antitoxin system PemK/MazF family toxin [Bacteroidota bacterium]
MNIKRGNVFLASLDPTIGNEINKTRPVIVISNDINNEFSNTVTVIPLTSNTIKLYPFEILLKSGIANLPKDSKARTDQIRTIDKSRIIKEIGSLPSIIISNLENAIKIHLNLK